MPFWSAAPDWFTRKDATARALWAIEPETWSFWLRRWDGLLPGRPLPDELQLKVALIPEATWTAVPGAVVGAAAGAIRAIEALAVTPACAHSDRCRPWALP